VRRPRCAAGARGKRPRFGRRRGARAASESVQVARKIPGSHRRSGGRLGVPVGAGSDRLGLRAPTTSGVARVRATPGSCGGDCFSSVGVTQPRPDGSCGRRGGSRCAPRAGARAGGSVGAARQSADRFVKELGTDNERDWGAGPGQVYHGIVLRAAAWGRFRARLGGIVAIVTNVRPAAGWRGLRSGSPGRPATARAARVRDSRSVPDWSRSWGWYPARTGSNPVRPVRPSQRVPVLAAHAHCTPLQGLRVVPSGGP
jgi:hypothetical protein